MTMKKKMIFVLLPVFVLSSCTSNSGHLLRKAEEAKDISRDDSASLDFKTFLDGMDSFCGEFMKEYALINDNRTTNLVSSPLSLYSALLLASEATSGNTRSEILSALNIKDEEKLVDNIKILYSLSQKERESEDKDVYSLKEVLANSIWFDSSFPLKDGILDTLSEKVYTSSFEVDFRKNSKKTNEIISEYVKKMTEGMIDEHFDFSSATDFLLMNTLYLKTVWNHNGSDLSLSKDTYSFTSRDGKTKDVNLMYLPREVGKIMKGDGYSSYRAMSSGGISLRFILPDEDKDIREVMDEKTIHDVIQADYDGMDEVNKKKYITTCYFPGFSSHSDSDVQSALKNLGIHDFFSEKCDTSPLSDRKTSCDGVRHVAKLDVDRKGVEGSALTVTSFATAIGPGPKIYEEVYEDFIVDRAFGYVITDNYGVPLFTGITNSI